MTKLSLLFGLRLGGLNIRVHSIHSFNSFIHSFIHSFIQITVEWLISLPIAGYRMLYHIRNASTLVCDRLNCCTDLNKLSTLCLATRNYRQLLYAEVGWIKV